MFVSTAQTMAGRIRQKAHRKKGRLVDWFFHSLSMALMPPHLIGLVAPNTHVLTYQCVFGFVRFCFYSVRIRITIDRTESLMHYGHTYKHIKQCME